MSLSDRANLFGDPTELLVAEAVWSFQHVNEYWPSWDQAIEEIADLAECEPEEAEGRLLAAINREEVIPLFDDDCDLYIALDQETADRIERRYLEMTLKRRHREEAE